MSYRLYLSKKGNNMNVKVIKNKENLDIIKNWLEYMSHHTGKDKVEKLINRASIKDIYYLTNKYFSHIAHPYVVLALLINMIAQNNSKRASYLIQQYNTVPQVGLLGLHIDEFPLSFADKEILYIVQCDIDILNIRFNYMEDFQNGVDIVSSNINNLTLTFSLDTLSKNWSKATIKNFIDIWMQINVIKVNNLQILFI